MLMSIGRVHAIRANAIHVVFEGRRYHCGLRGRMKKERWTTYKAAAPGDWVDFEPLPDGEGVIEGVRPRRNKVSRADPHNPRIEQVIVANADQLVTVHAAAEPDLNLLNVDRCTVLAEASELRTAIVINKIDLASPAGLEAYDGLGYAVVLTSALRGEGIDALRGLLAGRMSVFIGPSGVGKSTLLNAIYPSFALKTRQVSERTGEGTHTTSWVELLEVGGGLVADTPGLEFFTLWGVTRDSLYEHFPEFDAAHGKCGFSDCRHLSEPRCAAKVPGAVAASRYESYRTIHATLS